MQQIAQVSFTRTLEDAAATHAYLIRFDEILRRQIRQLQILVALLGLIAVAGTVGVNYQLDLIWRIFAGLVVASPFVGIILLAPRTLRKQAVARATEAYDLPWNRGLLGEYRVILRESWVEAETAEAKLRMHWSSVARCDLVDDYMFLMFAGGITTAVPKRAFADPKEFDEFVNCACRGYHRSAGSTVDPPSDVVAANS